MHLRRVLPFVVLTLTACPSVDRVGAPPDKLAFATFDSVNSVIPLPNDLALQRAPGLPTGVQKELLGSFVAAGGFPADQEVAITIPITIRSRQADGTYGASAAPDGLDLPTVDDAHVALFRVDVSPAQRLLRCATPVTAVCWEPSYAVPANSTSGQLSLRRNDPSGNRRWDAGGRYVVALRTGVRTSDGLSVNADGPVALIAPNHPLTVVENQPPGGLPAATAATVEGLRNLYATSRTWAPVPDAATCAGAGVPVSPCWLPLPSTSATAAFDVVQQVFPLAELAAIQTFTAQPAGAVRPLTDTGSGQLPLPSDFLLDPANGKVRKVSAFGPAADGLATLDGFSTTAPLLIPLTGPVKAATVLPSSAMMFEVTSGGLVPVVGMSVFPGAPAPSGPPQILVQPPTAVSSDGASSSVVLAPAVPVEAPGRPGIYLPPLKEKTQYLVVVTNQVKDLADQPLKRSTLMDLVFTFNGLLYDATKPAGSRSMVPGVADADAAGLQQLRASVGSALDALGLRSCANNATCAVLAYTVKTQNVKDVSISLSAAPYGIEAAVGKAVFAPSGTTEFTVPAGLGVTPTFTSVAKVFHTTFPTLYAIQGSTGAFDPALADLASWTPTQIQQHLRPLPALVAVPNAAAAALQPNCPAPADMLRCVPLVVYQHGLWGSTWQMLAVADALAAQGFAVAAIDMPYHGERSYCKSSAECVQADGSAGVCTPDPTLATPADAVAPGTCTTGTFAVNPTFYAPAASGNYFVSANFFRTRDALRQLVLDQSALTLALARPPAPAYPLQPAVNDLQAQLAGLGVVIDPTRVYFAGFSTGGMGGVAVVATNPRFKVATFTESGGSLVDVFTQGQANQDKLPAIFGPLGIDLACIQTGTGCDAATRAAQSAKYAQTLALAKWILDPAEPLNYAASVPTKAFHPNLAPLVAGGAGFATTTTYGQLVTGAQTVPNQNSRELFGLAGVNPYTTYTSAGAIAATDRHGLFIQNFRDASSPLQQGGDQMRADLASFLAGVAPATSRAIP